VPVSAQHSCHGTLRARIDQPAFDILPADGRAWIQVSFDGRKIGKVGPGEHLTLLPSPGKHIIAVNDDGLSLELAPNGQYYVRVSETGLWPRVKARLKLVPPEQGHYELTDLVGMPADQN